MTPVCVPAEVVKVIDVGEFTEAITYWTPWMMIGSPACEPRKFWPEVNVTDVPEVLTELKRDAYTVKLAPLTVAISAIVGLMPAQVVPLICAAAALR